MTCILLLKTDLLSVFVLRIHALLTPNSLQKHCGTSDSVGASEENIRSRNVNSCLPQPKKKIEWWCIVFGVFCTPPPPIMPKSLKLIVTGNRNGTPLALQHRLTPSCVRSVVGVPEGILLGLSGCHLISQNDLRCRWHTLGGGGVFGGFATRQRYTGVFRQMTDFRLFLLTFAETS